MKSLRLFSYSKEIFDNLKVKTIKTKRGVFANLEFEKALEFLEKKDVFLANRAYITTTEAEYYKIIKENDFIKPTLIKKKDNILYLYFKKIEEVRKYFEKKDYKIKKKKKNFQKKKNIVNIIEMIIHSMKIKSLTRQFQILFKRSRKKSKKAKKYKVINEQEIKNNLEMEDSPNSSPKRTEENQEEKKKDEENFENLEKNESNMEEQTEINDIIMEEKMEKNKKKDSAEEKKKDLKQFEKEKKKKVMDIQEAAVKNKIENLIITDKAKVNEINLPITKKQLGKKKKKNLELNNLEKISPEKEVEKYSPPIKRALIETKKRVKKLIQSKIKTKNKNSSLNTKNNDNSQKKGVIK
jgi:hypothetical protein